MGLLYSLRRRLPWPVTVLALMTTGCASLPAGQGRDEVASLVSARGRALEQRDDSDARKWVVAQLSQPLTADAAVRIALAQNPRLRSEYARLGIASAEVYDAGRLSNPRLSASIMFSNEAGAADQLSFGLAQSFTSLLLLGTRSRLAGGEFERVQQSVGAEILNLAAETETAFFELAGAQQVEKMRAVVANAAGLSAELAQRFFDAGNIKRLELSREQAAASQARLDLLEAQGHSAAARSALNALMGLNGGATRWTVTSGLPAPLPREDELPELLRLAGESRLDLLAARKEVELLADSLGLTRRFRYLGEMEVGVETERKTDRARLTGPNFTWELPLFSQNQGAVARAQAQLQGAEARLQELEIAATNAVQLASLRVANAKARAENYRSALIPQREQIVARSQEEVNYMLMGQFELLRAKQDEYDAYQGYLEAVRDYWVARAELAREVGTRLPSSAQATPELLDADELTRPQGGGMEGMDHDMPGMEPSGDGMKEMDHSGHGGASQKKPVPKKDAAPTMPPPRKDEGHSGMPTGMESHVPKRDGKSEPVPKKSDETDTQQHGDHP